MRIKITIFLTMCIGAGYYLLSQASVEHVGYIHQIPLAAVCCLSLCGTLFLALQVDGSRLRKICAFQLGAVALSSLVMLLFDLFTSSPVFPYLTPGHLICDNALACIFVLYPLELIFPNQLNLRRAALIFLPTAVLGAIYLGYAAIGNSSSSGIDGHEPGLPGMFSMPEGWLRLIIFSYPVWLYGWLFQHAFRNNLPAESALGALLMNYISGYFLLLFSHIIVMLANNPTSMMLHSAVMLVFAGYLLYQNIFNIQGGAAVHGLQTSKEQDNCGSEVQNCGKISTQKSFADKIPEYKETLERWMEEDKPYKDPHFKLIDCMLVLPLNRSYLSRLFNEGYSETFFAFVMRYRIEEGVRLLNTHPELTIACISEMCGFSSPSVFGRAFLKHKGISPLQYRRRCACKNLAS